MKTLTVYDPVLCCSSGVCGPSVDQSLVAFAADLKWLAGKGFMVQRFNMGKEPDKFVEQPKVYALLKQHGIGVLPAIVVNDELVKWGEYPTRTELGELVEIEGK